MTSTTSTTLLRRRMLLASALAVAAGPAFGQDTLVVGSWGGVWDDTVLESVGSIFTERTGAQIQIVPGTSTDQFARLIANPASPPFDVLYIDLDAAASGFESGMFRTLTEAAIPNLAGVHPNAIFGDGQAVAASFGAISIVYDSDWIDTVDSWEVFRDPAHAGDYALNSIDNWILYMLPVYGAIDAGDPADVDAGFAALAEIAPGAIAALNDTALRQSFASGEIAFAPMYSGEAYVMYLSGLTNIRLAQPAEGMVAVPNLLAIPANAAHPELAEAFINAALEESAQITFATEYASAPSVTGIELDPEIAQWMATGADALDALVRPDWVVLNMRRDELVQRWNTEITPLLGTE